MRRGAFKLVRVLLEPQVEEKPLQKWTLFFPETREAAEGFLGQELIEVILPSIFFAVLRSPSGVKCTPSGRHNVFNFANFAATGVADASPTWQQVSANQKVFSIFGAKSFFRRARRATKELSNLSE